MPAPYGIDLRERVLKACKNSGKKLKEIAGEITKALGKGSSMTISRALKRLNYVLTTRPYFCIPKV